jgi:polysaccharide export outer membrane protein
MDFKKAVTRQLIDDYRSLDNMNTLFKFFTLSFILILITACAAPLSGSYKILPGGVTEKIETSQLQSPVLSYRFYAGDVVSVKFDQLKISNNTNAQYRIEKRDLLNISFSQQPSKNYRLASGDKLLLNIQGEDEIAYEVLVAPDGRVVLPRIGRRLKVAGLTIDQLKSRSIAEYEKLFLEPKVYWSLITSFSKDLTELSGEYSVGSEGAIAIPNLGRFEVLGKTIEDVMDELGQTVSARYGNDISANVSYRLGNIFEIDEIQSEDNLSTKISMDGSLYIRGFGLVQAVGKTAKELEQLIINKVQPLYQNPLSVNVQLLDYADNSVYIGGDVNRPGRYPYISNLSILRLIATAGWAKSSGDLTKVIVLRVNQNNGYDIFMTNLQEIFEGKGESAQDFKVGPQDLIVIPPTRIAKANQFVKDYIRGLLPFGINVNYNLNFEDQQ